MSTPKRPRPTGGYPAGYTDRQLAPPPASVTQPATPPLRMPIGSAGSSTGQQPQPQPVIVNVTQPVQPHTANRLLHGVMTLVTGGLWLPVWLIAEHRAKRRA